MVNIKYYKLINIIDQPLYKATAHSSHTKTSLKFLSLVGQKIASTHKEKNLKRYFLHSFARKSRLMYISKERTKII